MIGFKFHLCYHGPVCHGSYTSVVLALASVQSPTLNAFGAVGRACRILGVAKTSLTGAMLVVGLWSHRRYCYNAVVFSSRLSNPETLAVTSLSTLERLGRWAVARVVHLSARKRCPGRR